MAIIQSLVLLATLSSILVPKSFSQMVDPYNLPYLSPIDFDREAEAEYLPYQKSRHQHIVSDDILRNDFDRQPEPELFPYPKTQYEHIFSEDIFSTDLERQVEVEWSPYSKSLYQYLVSDQIFEKLFNSSFTPCEARTAFFYDWFHFADSFDLKYPEGVLDELVKASEMFFSRKVTPLQYYHVYSKIFDPYLNNILLSDDVERTVYKHFTSLRDSLLDAGPINDPIAALTTVNKANVNFMKTISNIDYERLENMMRTAIDTFNKDRINLDRFTFP